MGHFIDEVSDQLNLRWAWEKVRREATPGDIWFDEIDLARFDLELEKNLQSIADDFSKGRYQMMPIRPLPFPKQNKKDGTRQVRQVFQVAIRDQVAWTAVVNVVGPYVDSQMPPWSYGNRLYRTIWVQKDEDGKKRRKVGRYRHASGRLYLPFGQSWPIFRRHVYLATRAMTQASKIPDLDERTAEEQEIQEQPQLPASHRCPFVMKEYWRDRRPENAQELYWCSIDLEKFYPTMKLTSVHANIIANIPFGWREEASRLLQSMMKFRLDKQDWPDVEDLGKMGIKPPSRKNYSNIPTGLYVAGFLANAGLLKVDREVAVLLEKYAIAHFRFVDDHIFVAYDFEELINWLNEYRDLLAKAGTGAKINLEKVEPAELATYMESPGKAPTSKRYKALKEEAAKKCQLDPQFPSPLMTKTLALVSGIARTDVNLLEQNELAALTDQLEHLLIVDLPDEEIPARTRLSFAAMRLTRIVESRLAKDATRAVLSCKLQTLNAEINRRDPEDAERMKIISDRQEQTKKLEIQNEARTREVSRVFQLLRKVLRERPDRIRLWTRAVLMCRLTGVRGGLDDLFRDISRESEKNPLVAEYLQANILGLLGTQVIIASRILRSEDTAEWRKIAVHDFLVDICKANIKKPEKDNTRWFSRMAWQHYCFGIYCADLILRGAAHKKDPSDLSFSKVILNEGRKCISNGSMGYDPVYWAWWASRMTLRDGTSRASSLVKMLGEPLKPSHDSAAFWCFFPQDAPTRILQYMLLGKGSVVDSAMQSGWWYDALRGRCEIVPELKGIEKGHTIKKVFHLLTEKKKDTISLHEWCDYMRTSQGEYSADPRNSEWTALEIVRQIALLVGKERTFDIYIKEAKHHKKHLSWVHPANFRLPRAWLSEEKSSKDLSWDDWKKLLQGKNIKYVPKSELIIDTRYTPLKNNQSALFSSVNPTRGLGLLLYGLLRKNFDLPAVWNGPGHSDVLGMLPRLLLEDMTCSSPTLGILQSCLQPRVTENQFLRVYPQDGHADDDMLLDPYLFLDANDVASALDKCQKFLMDCQLSTLRHRARQLTPISIRQLTEPDWSKVFGGGNQNE